MKTNLLALLLLFSGIQLFAQEKTISGTVISADDGLPLPGANVVIKNQSTGTTTDFDGNYEIEVAPEDVLTFSFIGFQTQEVKVGGQETIDVNLIADTESLSEIVLIGYGAAEKQDLTGAISSVKSDEILKQPALTATQAVQGKVAGVNIINSDSPGSTPTVTIRGLGTALGGRNPLYVVDGVPVTDIKNISPSNIESMDFLKDASSASIYGLRAANGVVIVTTKKGKKGKAKLSFNSYYGVKSLLNKVDMANASQYTQYYNEEETAIGSTSLLAPNQRYNTDWLDELTQLGAVSNNVFTISGGSENVDYFFSYDHYEEEGLLPNQKYRRSVITSNNAFKLFDDKLKVTQNLSITPTNENPKPLSSFNTAYRQAPVIPVYYENGLYGQSFYNQATGEATYMAQEGEAVGRLTDAGNPVAAVNFANEKISTLTLQGSVTAELELTDHLTFTSRIGMRKYYYNKRAFTPTKKSWIANDPTRTAEAFENNRTQFPDSPEWARNSLAFEKEETFKYNWDNFINYKRSFGQHNFDLTLGGSKEETGIGEKNTSSAYEVPEAEQYWSIKHAGDSYDKQTNQYYFTQVNYMSQFGRLQYNFDRTYYLTATLRRDGTSVFKSNKEYFDYFPSVGLGWTLSNESFLENSNFLNYLKLRGSYGELGNAKVPFNTTTIQTNAASGNQNYVFGPNQGLVFGASIGSPAQPLSWEVVQEWSAGFDYELLDNRLTGSFDWYDKTTTNTILEIQPLLNSPFAEKFYDHGAKVVNKGVEVGINWSDNISDDFSYNVGVTYNYNKNEITQVKNNYAGQTGGSLDNGQISKRLEEGQPLGSWWMYEADGVWQTQEEIDNNASLGGALPGHLKYKDQNEDGVIDERDKKYFGSYIPKYNFGINIAVNYKNFDFSVAGYGAGGNKVYNGLTGTRLGGENIPVEVFENRWTGAGSTNANPGANKDAYASSHYLEDGDYFRINNITFGYTLPEIKMVSKARVYVSAQNAFIFTKYSGFTPELNSDGNPYGTTGIELSAYPNTSTFLMGLNLEF
ncbi:SusC/RagA family TonB-linked outer membrane protein [Mesonia aestuariivivens]|uniref:TonB-dependent receptor n=1 Tax=Mesonia aestuariivivens TaxID=2796128 RepID=A0ABS6W4G7_9FLAO|nr:TonB-dependent receptor [Mesonia aestuariivivens]MBW2961979.1 TonB-dependent receptor [Mesonia aestuariivivens]